MLISDFLSKVAGHPHLEVVHHDSTMCILRRNGAAKPQTIRVGFWAVRRLRWEQLAKAWEIPPEADQAPAAATMNRSPASSRP